MMELSHDQGCPFGMDNKMERLERELGEVKSTVILLDDRQRRMHEDFQQLTDAMNKNTDAITEVVGIMSNRKGFVAGVVTVVTLLGGILAAVLGTALEWFK